MRNGALAILGIGAVVIAIGSGAQAQQKPAALPRSVSVKLEWASRVPRGTDHITLVADSGYLATATTQGGRTVKIKAVLNADKTVTTNLRISGPSTESVETELTTEAGETRVVQAVRMLKGKDSQERLLFVTASPVEY